MKIGSFTKTDIERAIEPLPRERYAFLPTPFHKLENISKDYGVNIFFKREDMSGPSNFGGNKVRKLEFLMGDARQQGYDTMITVGAFQSNSATAFIQFCNKCNIHPVVFLLDNHNCGEPQKVSDYEGNLRLMKLLGAEMHYVPQGNPNEGLYDEVYRQVDKYKKELEKKGHKVAMLPSGCAADGAMISYTLAFAEIMEQSKGLGIKLDYVYNTQGTGGSLPGLIAGKYLMGADVELRQIMINPFADDYLCGTDETIRRVHCALDSIGIHDYPTDEWIKKQINPEERFFVEYGYPTEQGNKAILELAKREGIFTDTVYSGKGIAGLFEHIKEGLVPQGSNVCFIHSGGTGALFAGEEVIGDLL